MNPQTLVGLSDHAALSGYPLSRLLALECPEKHLDMYFFLNCLKKNPYVLGESTSDATVRDFLDAEKHASRFNILFDQLLAHDGMRNYLERWREEVRLIMGKFSWGRPHITSGATTTSPKGNRPIERFAAPECSLELDLYLQKHGVPFDVPWDSYGISIGKGSCVPKTATIGRLIGKPLAVNAYFQTSLGKTLNDRLRRRGIDFTYAQDVHKRLARLASIKGHLVTDDQKWASILVYRSLVQYLVSEEWFIPLDACRDKYLELPDGTQVKLNQFATMGNGFCFELETIIFLGLLYTAAHFNGVPRSHKDIKVFGDDLIYPIALLGHVRAIGKNVGFITNVDKSFSEGPFRESCGGDYLAGLDIRPVYLNRDVNHPYDLTIMANQVYSLLEKFDFKLPIMQRIWIRLVRRIYSLGGRKSVLWGPSHLSCLSGMPEAGWRTSVSKWNRVTIHVWETVPEEYTHFKAIAKKCAPAYLLNMLSAGYGSGMGSLMVPEQRLRSWIFGPPKPRSCYYPLVKVAGSAERPRIVEKQLFFEPSLVPHDKPLDVFKVLPLTGAPKRLSAKDYHRAVEADKADLLDRLHFVLGRALEVKKAEVAALEPLFIDL